MDDHDRVVDSARNIARRSFGGRSRQMPGVNNVDQSRAQGPTDHVRAKQVAHCSERGLRAVQPTARAGIILAPCSFEH